MQWVTTTIVLEHLAREEAGAWELFVRRFRQPVIRFARDLGLSEDEAEDVVQETLASFLRAYRNGRYDRDKGRLSSWLFGIAHRTAMKIRSKAARQQRLAPVRGRTAFWDDLPDKEAARRSWDQSWEQAMFRQCLEQVRVEVEPATMLAFEAVSFHDRRASEVAAELGITSNAVFLAKHRVLKRLRELQQELEGAA